MLDSTSTSAFDFVAIKRRLLLMHFESGVGHIGGNLSSLDAMLVAFHRHLKPDDHFVLSKGHSAGALYATLWSLGLLDDDDLRSFHQDGTVLAGHPSANGVPKIEFATGSLGHGVSLAAGLALGARFQNSGAHAVCLCSDGEWQEGSSWEGLIFAAHHRLSNLTIMIDHNGLQGFGSTSAIAGPSTLASRLSGFGATVLSIDGHDVEAIQTALESPTDTVKVIVLDTIKGHGVTFMENRMEWHYNALTRELLDQANAELDSSA
jgi:transketolase